MRYSELLESMSFSAGHKDPKSNYWVSDTDSGDPYTDEFYKNTDKYMYSDDEPPANPNYKEELDLTLSNASMRDVMDTLGYTTDLENSAPFPSAGIFNPYERTELDALEPSGCLVEKSP